MGIIAQGGIVTAAARLEFNRKVKEGNLKLHPLVARLVDAEVLRKMGAKRMGGDK